MADKNRKWEEEKRLLGERMWLSYYNKVLLDCGMLTEQEWTRMESRIESTAMQNRKQ